MAETTPPIIATAVARADGTAIDGTFTEAGSPPVLPASGAATFSLRGTAATVASVVISGLAFTITLNGTIKSSTYETPTLFYAAGNVHDSAASPNYMVDAGPIAITNNSTVTIAAGVYCDITDIQAEMGRYNELISADPDSDNNPFTIARNEQKSCDFTTSFINATLEANGMVAPATVQLGMLRIIAAKLGAWQLYQIRGLQDDKISGKFQIKYDWAVEQLGELIDRNVFTRGTGFANAMASTAPSVMPDGAPVPVRARGPYFNGICWVWG